MEHDEEVEGIDVLDAIGDQFRTLAEKNPVTTRTRVPRRAGYALVVLTAFGLVSGAYAALSGSHDGQAPSVVSDLCGDHQTPDSEAVVDELDLATKPDAVRSIARSQFGSRFVGLDAERAKCPSVLLVFVADLTASDRSQLSAALKERPDIDAERVEVRSAPFTRAPILEAQSTVNRILSNRRITSARTSVNLTDGYVLVEAAQLSSAVTRQIEEEVTVPVHFDIGSDFEPLDFGRPG